MVNPYTFTQDVLAFCKLRLNAQAMDQIIKENKETGLSNEETLNQQLQDSDYIPVLKAVWSERDRSKRLKWLQTHAGELHVPLMYEQAIAEFTNLPTAKILQEISIPLIKAANFRLAQDMVCLKEDSKLACSWPAKMDACYEAILSNQTSKYLSHPLSFYLNDKNFFISLINATEAKTAQVAKQSLIIALPSLNWIRCYGEIRPSSENQLLRQGMANEFFETEEMGAKLKEIKLAALSKS